jgi:hypothetical protein
MYERSILRQPLSVYSGRAAIPDAPGLGVDVDWQTVEQYRVAPGAKPYPAPDLLIQVVWPTGEVDDYAHGLQYWDDFLSGRRPIFQPGVRLELVPDDGSARWQQRRAAALTRPAWVMRPN